MGETLTHGRCPPLVPNAPGGNGDLPTSFALSTMAMSFEVDSYFFFAPPYTFPPTALVEWYGPGLLRRWRTRENHRARSVIPTTFCHGARAVGQEDSTIPEYLAIIAFFQTTTTTTITRLQNEFCDKTGHSMPLETQAPRSTLEKSCSNEH